MEFTDLHKHRDFIQLYDKALRTADIRQHPDFSKRQLEILDIQGGNGILGRLLYEDLGSKIVYTNVDNDENALNLSPPKTLRYDSHFLRRALKGRRFDYIFCLNHDTHVWLPYFADTENPFSDNYIDVVSIKGLMSGILLLQAAVYLREDGIFLKGGVLTDDNISAFAKFLEEKRTGLEFKKSDDLELSDAVAREFASYDVRRRVNDRLNWETRQYEKVPEEEIRSIAEESINHYRTLKIVIFQKVKNGGNGKELLEKLVQYEESLGSAYSQIEGMDRFGPI